MMISTVLSLLDQPQDLNPISHELVNLYLIKNIYIDITKIITLILDLGTTFSTRIVTAHAFLHNNKLFES